jgi:putative membrane protein
MRGMSGIRGGESGGGAGGQVPAAEPGVFAPGHVCSPHPKLLTHYAILCAFTLVAFPLTFLVSYFRYHTLRYRFDADGVTMTVGILFRREVALTYRRIQDIHVTRGIIQRWLGLATVSCQTASAGSGPELVIEGMMEYERVRDYLYQQMRGAKGEVTGAGDASAAPNTARPADEALALLHEIRDGIAGMRREMDALRGGEDRGARG